jgi:ABC-type phosphate transport system substrate-binding protein
MRFGKLTVGLAIAGTVAGMAVMAVQPAYADYAPTAKDVVGVGSDTLQYLVDFAADGDNLGDPGFNSNSPKYRLINFDATADANARLAYGSGGATGQGVAGVAAGQCGPGTGGTAGTGNQTITHADSPCTLNPTIVLRAGVSPVQRPNGSGAGAKALAADTSHFITFSRASACQGPTTGCGHKLTSAFDSIQVGSDPLAMLTASTTNAVPLSNAQLTAIYTCTATTWAAVGSTGPNASHTIIPIIPQAGSGTRSSFESAIGVTDATLGACVKVGEENDPTAIAVQSSPADAIEPMSGGRLNLFQGLLSTGVASGQGGYFRDPSCSLDAINTSATGCAAPGNTISPAVTLVTTGTPSDNNPLFHIDRPLYIYFRDTDVNSTTSWQGGTLNAVRTLFYNPCKDNPIVPGDGCTAGTGSLAGLNFGPGGAPYFAQAGTQADISASGIVPAYVPTVGGP